jgi:hypothetical protein
MGQIAPDPRVKGLVKVGSHTANTNKNVRNEQNNASNVLPVSGHMNSLRVLEKHHLNGKTPLLLLPQNCHDRTETRGHPGQANNLVPLR